MSGVYGADVSTPMSVAQWQALTMQAGVALGIVRCYESSGQVDPNAAASTNAGWAAGLTSVDVYHCPCVNGQVSAQAQVQAAFHALSAVNARFGCYWIEVEQGAGWSTTKNSSNSQFLTQLVEAAQQLGLTVGILTSSLVWGSIINNAQFAQWPLWYAVGDNQPNFEDFISFGGWTQPVMKQYASAVSNSGISYNADWAPGLVQKSSLPSTYPSPVATP